MSLASLILYSGFSFLTLDGRGMDLDLSSLWSWTIPLWGLFLIVLFLCGVMSQHAVLQALEPQTGGHWTNGPKKKVRFGFSSSK